MLAAKTLYDMGIPNVAYIAGGDAPTVKHILLNMSAVNFVDTSALESLDNLVDQLRDANVTIHMAG